MGVTVTAHGDPEPSPTPTTTATTTTLKPPDPQGSGCDAYKKQVPTGNGSFAGMATESLPHAVASNPMLTTLNAAISGQLNPAVNIIGTIDSGRTSCSRR